jgi:hypothetical protein
MRAGMEKIQQAARIRANSTQSKGGDVLRKNISIRRFYAVCGLAVIIVASAGCVPGEKAATAPGKKAGALENRLRALEDRESIRRLLMNYGRFLDRRDFESFSLLFAENEGEWIGGMGRAKGQKAIRRLMEDTIGTQSGEESPGNFHLFTNDSIDLKGDSATAVTKWIFMVRNAGGKPEPFYLGHYEDELVIEKGQWKFLRRVVFTDIPADNPETGGTE